MLITSFLFQDFRLESARRRIQTQKLPGEDTSNLEDQRIMINALINPLYENMNRACGALLKYLDKNRVGGLNLECGGVPILAIKPFTPQDVICVDESTLSALQIFNTRWQTSGSRAGSWNQSREGNSIFSLLNRCKSVHGSRQLKYLLRCLPTKIEVIQSRQEAVAYFSQPDKIEVIKTMQDCLKKIKLISRCLKKLSASQASVQDWKITRNTITNMLALGQVCASHASAHPEAPEILQRMASLAIERADFNTTVRYIEKVFEVQESEENCRFVVKKGVDESLDAKKRVHNGLPDLLHELATEEVENLPECMRSCTMLYVPQIGYMLAIQPWLNMPTNAEDFHFPDLKFMFIANNVPHFKSQRCLELDESMGDTATNICDHETSIMIALSAHILKQSALLTDFAHLASQLDCLLALALVAKENDWCRPSMNEEETMIIREGRHPLQEKCVSTFVSNSTFMGGEHDKLMILTGPNACGKSVYLKQIGLIVFLAHLGSWVPATFAQIPIIDAIYTRIQTVDSVSLGLSAFTVDLDQVSTALNHATSKSLVLLDEFGKGTCDVDGQALLASALEYWLAKGPSNCPTLVVSTHFHSVKTLLNDFEDYISYMTFEVGHESDGELIYLYQIKPGTTTHSEANQVAKKAGIDPKILQRSHHILDVLSNGQPLKMPEEDQIGFSQMQSTIDEFLNTELNEENLAEMLNKITNLMELE